MGDDWQTRSAPGRRGPVPFDDSLAGRPSSVPSAGKQTLTEQLSEEGAASSQPASEPAPRDGAPAKKRPSIAGKVVAGPPLTDADVDQIEKAAQSVPVQFKRYLAYGDVIKVGGSLAWRANNPGNLRNASSKIATVQGAVGTFAVFATMTAGRAAQRELYLGKYGASSVQDAVEHLTPPSENNTVKYLKDLEAAGVRLDQTVSSQIDLLMKAVEANEGMIKGVEVPRSAG